MRIRRKLLLGYLVGISVLVVVFLATILGLVSLQREIVGDNERIYLVSQSLYSVKKAQVSFRQQVQEWKDLLLRGNDQPSFDKYRGQFEVKEAEVVRYLRETAETLEKLAFTDGVNMIRALLVKHEALGARYREALKSYDTANIRSFQIVDSMVKGIDRVPNGDMDAIAAKLDTMNAGILQGERLEVESAIRHLLGLLVILSVAGALCMVLLSLILAGRITRPILAISEATGALAGGDLRFRLAAEQGDEIGQMGGRFNHFLDRLAETIHGIKENTASGKLTVNELLEAMGKTKSSIDEINAMAAEVRDVIVDQSSSVTEISATIGQITGNIEHQNERVVAQSSSVAESSAAIEEMIANIKSIDSNLNNSAREFEQLHKAVGSGSSDLKRLRDMIIALSRQSDGVLEANNTINNIASQTNLLAMNAAIEAAHAGASGKGFAVVAGEIRKLAELSNRQSVIISENLKQLKGSIESAVSLSDSTASSFAGLVQSVEVVTRLENEIKSSLNEQASGSNQILDSLNRISAITGEVQTGSDEMLGGSRGITSEIGDLIRITEKVRDNALRVVEKAGEIQENIDRSILHLNANVGSIQGIEAHVSVFTIPEPGADVPDL